MISPGIYIRKKVGFLVDELSEKLEGLIRTGDVSVTPPETEGTASGVTVWLCDRKDGWCHIEVAGDAQAISIVTDFLTGHKSLGDILVWNCNDDVKEYSYTLFRGGKILEQFSVKGSALDTVSYVSELKKVQLQDLINAREFALEALRRFGVCLEIEKETGSRKVKLEFTYPPKRSIWRSLLGSLSGRE
jgi:hypothetical protein